MAISVLQRHIAGNAALVSNPATAFASNVTAGSNLIAVTFLDSSVATIGTPTDTLGNTFLPLTPIKTASSMELAVHIAYNTPSGADTITFSTGFNDSAVAMFEVAGLASHSAFDKMAYAVQQSATALSSGNTAVTTYPNELLLGLTININSTALNPTVGAGYSNLQTVGVTFASSATEEQIVSSTGVQSATFTLGANSTNILTAIYTFSDTPIAGTKFNNAGVKPHPFSPGIAR